MKASNLFFFSESTVILRRDIKWIGVIHHQSNLENWLKVSYFIEKV